MEWALTDKSFEYVVFCLKEETQIGEMEELQGIHSPGLQVIPN